MENVKRRTHKLTIAATHRCKHDTDINIYKLFTLNICVKVLVYTIRNGPIQWEISTSIKVVNDHFSPATMFWRYSHLKCYAPENVGQGHDSRCTIFAMAPLNGDYMTSYLMITVTFALSLTIYRYSQIR